MGGGALARCAGQKPPPIYEMAYMEPAMHEHTYSITVRWTGNRGEGTATYRGYGRDHEITGAGKPVLVGSSDPVFRGDGARYNPEELFVASLSTCHMLWFLHKCAEAGAVLEEYDDEPVGYMTEESNGGGQFRLVVLRPRARFRDRVGAEQLQALHEASHALCFIARSVNFPVRVEPRD